MIALQIDAFSQDIQKQKDQTSELLKGVSKHYFLFVSVLKVCSEFRRLQPHQL